MKGHSGINSFPKGDPTHEKQSQGEKPGISIPEAVLDLYLLQYLSQLFLWVKSLEIFMASV